MSILNSVLQVLREGVIPFLTAVNTGLLIKYALTDGPEFKGKSITEGLWSYAECKDKSIGINKKIYIFLPYISIYNIGSKPSEIHDVNLYVEGINLQLNKSPLSYIQTPLTSGEAINSPIFFNGKNEPINPGSSKSGYILYSLITNNDCTVSEDQFFFGTIKYRELSRKNKTNKIEKIPFKYIPAKEIRKKNEDIFKSIFIEGKDIEFKY